MTQLKVQLLDKSTTGLEGIIDTLGLCRDTQCNEKTVKHCMEAQPVPHLSMLEHVWFKFRVEGLSVKARIQLIRHRAFSTMERSTRFINLSNAEFVIPPKARNQKLFSQHYQNAIEVYQYGLDNGESIEDMAYVLPLGLTTKFDLSGNGRVWFEYLQKRLCSKHVQDEHYEFAKAIWNEIMAIEGMNKIFKYAHPCSNCGICWNTN